jgi:predicted metal-dependent peptidase
MNTEAENKMTRARVGLIIHEPFWGTLSTQLELLQRPNLNPPTMATDGRRIYYHPQFVNASPLNEVKYIIAHEVGHCMLDHMCRRNGRDSMIWNVACDYAVNSLLIDSGFTMPASGLYDMRFKDMSVEAIYNVLLKEAKPGDKPMDWVMDAQPGDGDGDDKDGDGINDNEANLAQAWKNAVIQAANAARAAGKLKGALERFVGGMVVNSTDWRSRLRQFCVEESKDDYSYARFNRRFASLGIFLPGLYSEAMGTMVIVTDDSGSIGDDILQRFAGEISSIRDAVRPKRTIVISCDAHVNHVDDLGEWDEFKLKCHGGGGTDFRPPFRWLERQGIEPACLVYLTDLYGNFPERAPNYPVLWCSTTNLIAPWGETLKVSES